MRQHFPMVSPVHEQWIPAPRRQQNQQRYWWSCSGSTAPNSLCKIFRAEMQLTCKLQKCWHIPELATCSSCCCIYCSFPERLALPDTQRRRRRPASLHQPRPLERRKHVRGIEMSLKWYLSARQSNHDWWDNGFLRYLSHQLCLRGLRIFKNKRWDEQEPRRFHAGLVTPAQNLWRSKKICHPRQRNPQKWPRFKVFALSESHLWLYWSLCLCFSVKLEIEKL